MKIERSWRPENQLRSQSPDPDPSNTRCGGPRLNMISTNPFGSSASRNGESLPWTSQYSFTIPAKSSSGCARASDHVPSEVVCLISSIGPGIRNESTPSDEHWLLLAPPQPLKKGNHRGSNYLGTVHENRVSRSRKLDDGRVR